MNTALMDYPAMGRPFENVGAKPPFDSNSVCEVLREAIEVLRDREKDFRQAAEHVSTASLKSDLLSYGGQRSLFVGELQDLERTYGREYVDNTGSVTGALHRVWAGMKFALTKRNDRSILEEVTAGEKEAADFYVDVLATRRGLPLQVSQCLSRQCAELQKGQFELSNRAHAFRE